MSLQIPIQKNIADYEEKIVGKMSLRTSVCVAGGFASAIGAACVTYFGFGIPVADATLPVMASALPFWLAGFWRPYGMRLEHFVPLFAEHHLGDQHMEYRPYAALQAAPRPAARKQRLRERRAFKRKGGESYEPTKA